MERSLSIYKEVEVIVVFKFFQSNYVAERTREVRAYLPSKVFEKEFIVAPTSFSFLHKACMCTSKKRSEQSSGCAQKNIRGSKNKIERLVILDCKLIFDEHLKCYL